jgi:hypothetical protein
MFARRAIFARLRDVASPARPTAATGNAEPMETTKTGKLQQISLPADLIEISKWHGDQLPKGPMRDSDLLFRVDGRISGHPAVSIARFVKS